MRERFGEIGVRAHFRLLHRVQQPEQLPLARRGGDVILDVVIEDDVHIGSDVQLIAPVTVGRGATIAAGATITDDVPAGGLTLTEKKQVTKPGWQRPRKK